MPEIENTVEETSKPKILDIDRIHAELRESLTKELAESEERSIMLRGAIQGVDLLLKRLLDAKIGDDSDS